MYTYRYDDNGYYIAQEIAFIDPLESKLAGHSVYLLPANSTFTAPPTAKAGYLRKWNGSKWEQEKEAAEPEEPLPTLAETQTAKIAQLKTERNSREQAPIATAIGTFDYDTISLIRLNEAKDALAGTTNTILWTLADNTKASVNYDDIMAVKSAGVVRSNALHAKYNLLKTAVNACATAEDVNAITFDSEVQNDTNDL